MSKTVNCWNTFLAIMRLAMCLSWIWWSTSLCLNFVILVVKGGQKCPLTGLSGRIMLNNKIIFSKRKERASLPLCYMKWGLLSFYMWISSSPNVCLCVSSCLLHYLLGEGLSIVCIWMSEDNMWQPSFHHVCSVDETQVINLGDKHTCSQSHLTCPVSFLKFIYLLQEQKLCLVFSCSSIYGHTSHSTVYIQEKLL